MQLTENAVTVLEKRYLLRDEAGQILEKPVQLFERVARAIAQAEPQRRRKHWEKRFLEMMVSRRFIPNTPTLINAGQPKGQLSACFVLPIEDSLEGIFETLKFSAKIHQSGGGTGFSFSRIRPKGNRVKSTHGVASGPVSFIRIYDSATETIKQGGARRGANMAVLRVDHPDILEFIDCKRDGHSIANFNISVGVTDEFMRALEAGAEYSLIEPGTGREVRKTSAKGIFERMVDSAWTCGDPGMVFLDRISAFNPTPRVGEMESTNPCGEQPLLPFESCNLGSLNLGEYFVGGRELVDWGKLKIDINGAVRFLDNVIEENHYPLAECGKITRRNRKIGLGVMGFADLLLLAGIPYSSEEGLRIGERVMSFIDREAKTSSMQLAGERGAFPNWRGSLWERLGYPPLRNATVSTVAPTGTISMIAGASSGIEPIFAASMVRNVLDGEKLFEVHPAVMAAIRAKSVQADSWAEEKVARILGPAWCPARDVPVKSHVQMQAVFQRHSDSAVSKTVNLPSHSTLGDVAEAYLLAYRLGCKGITVYRDQSRPTQVLQAVPIAESCEVCN